MNDFFGPGGIFDRKLPGYEYRPAQVRMAEAVRDALERQEHVIMEAGTGTGKTLAYLLPAIMSQRRLLVSTGTKALQDQIFYKDIPLLESVLERPIRAAYLKGRNNYLCRLKAQTLDQDGLLRPADLKVFRQITAWAAQTETGDRAELRGVPEDSELWSELDARRERCLGTRCIEFDRCFLTLMRQKAMESDIVVVNHHLFFADLSIRESEVASILPDYSGVIFDEAHELEDVATQYFGFHVSSYRVRELGSDSGALAERSEVELGSEVEAVARASGRFFDRLSVPGEGKHPLQEIEGIDALIEAIKDLRSALRQQHDFRGEWDGLARRAGEIAAALDVFRRGNLDNYVSWAERRGRGVFLRASPIDVSSILRERLFDRIPTCVLTSATLSVAGSFDHMRSRLGLHGTHGESLSAEFDLEEQARLYVPGDLPDYRHPSYLDRAAEDIKTILDISQGRAFVLFTSYHQMSAAHAIVAPDVPYPCLIQGKASRTRLLEDFRATPNAVLFATASFWQGIDVQGDMLSCVIIDKLPFQVPSDPLVNARMLEVEQKGGNPFTEYLVPTAILRLRQGFGRLIRSRTDHGILAILDSRLRTKSYGRVFLASLPDYIVTDRLGDLREFMSEKM